MTAQDRPQRVYLDWNATAPLRPEARAAMAAAFEIAGNPSSVHAEGRAARALVERGRGVVAAAIGAEPSGMIFTSGGTEANALALSPGWRGLAGEPAQRLVVSAIEHPSVLTGGRFAPDLVTRAPVTSDGLIDLEALESLLRGRPPTLVSVMLANNETGTIQPVRAVAGIVHRHGGLLHVDAVQAFGRIAMDCRDLGADLLTLSAHKLGGPKGVGALALASGLHLADGLIRGGGQERSRRAGTENVAGIAGFAAAVEAALAGLTTEHARLARLQDRLEQAIAMVPGARIFGAAAPRLPNTTLFSAPGLQAETAVIAFDLEGFAVSSGAACSSGKVQPSHVLEAMGVESQLARGAIRVSLGYDSAETDVERCIGAWIKLSDVLLTGGRNSG